MLRRVFTILFIAGLPLLVVGYAPVGKSASQKGQGGSVGQHSVQEQANLRIVHRLHEEVWTQGNLAVVNELISDNFLGHFPGGDWHGAAEYKRRAIRLRAAFPDWSETEEDAFAHGDKVVSRWTGRGTHKGEFLGIGATGKQVVVSEMAIYRIVEGKIVERWSELDRLGMLQQLGAVPSFSFSTPTETGR